MGGRREEEGERGVKDREKRRWERGEGKWTVKKDREEGEEKRRRRKEKERESTERAKGQMEEERKRRREEERSREDRTEEIQLLYCE